MIRLCSILDLADILDITEDSVHLKYLLCDKKSRVYANEDNTALAFYTRINSFALDAHVESTKDCRGFKLKQFLIDSGKDAVVSDPEISSVINFVDKENKKLLLFSATFGERVGAVGDKIMFVTERERYL